MVTHQKGFGLVAIIVGAVLLVGAGALVWYVLQKNQPANPTATTSQKTHKTLTDACALTTKTDLETLFAVTFNNAKSVPSQKSTAGLDGSGCTFEQVNDGTSYGVASALNVSLTIENYGSAEKAISAMELIRSSATFGGTVYYERTEVGGVGDEAFFQGLKPLKAQPDETLYIRNDSQILVCNAVHMGAIDHAEFQAWLTELAKKALN